MRYELSARFSIDIEPSLKGELEDNGFLFVLHDVLQNTYVWPRKHRTCKIIDLVPSKDNKKQYE